MKYIIITMLISLNILSAENPSNHLKKVFFKFDNHNFDGRPFKNKNMDNAGFIINENEITGTLHIQIEDNTEYRLKVKARYDGIGAVAFAKWVEVSTQLGIKGLAGNPISDIFDSPFYGRRIGAWLIGGFHNDMALSPNGLLAHDSGVGAAIGIDFENYRLEFFPLDQWKYNQIKDIVLY